MQRRSNDFNQTPLYRERKNKSQLFTLPSHLSPPSPCLHRAHPPFPFQQPGMPSLPAALVCHPPSQPYQTVSSPSSCKLPPLHGQCLIILFSPSLYIQTTKAFLYYSSEHNSFTYNVFFHYYIDASFPFLSPPASPFPLLSLSLSYSLALYTSLPSPIPSAPPLTVPLLPSILGNTGQRPHQRKWKNGCTSHILIETKCL